MLIKSDIHLRRTVVFILCSSNSLLRVVYSHHLKFELSHHNYHTPVLWLIRSSNPDHSVILHFLLHWFTLFLFRKSWDQLYFCKKTSLLVIRTICLKLVSVATERQSIVFSHGFRGPEVLENMISKQFDSTIRFTVSSSLCEFWEPAIRVFKKERVSSGISEDLICYGVVWCKLWQIRFLYIINYTAET